MIHGQIVMNFHVNFHMPPFQDQRTMERSYWAIAKMVKIFRILRVVRLLSEVRTMITSIAGSVVSLFWVCVMLSFFVFFFSVMMIGIKNSGHVGLA